MRLILTFVLALVSFQSSFAEVPDFSVQVGLDPGAKVRGWLFLFTPPEKHHFNVDAPMSVTSGEGIFIKVGAAPTAIGYVSSDTKLKDNAPVIASLFLCDDAKTYCVKKTLTFPLKVNSDLKKIVIPKTEAAKPAPKSKSIKKRKGKKDEHAFWDNDLESAVKEAQASKKPILIDFYGIWCPPCNLFNETVFPNKKFKAAALKWVLLKIDADRLESNEIKSVFKVGGYPTLIAVQAPKSGEKLTSSLEIERIVGFYPLNEFISMMAHAYENRSIPMEERLDHKRQDFAKALKEMIENKIEKKETLDAQKLLDEGSRLLPNDHFFSVHSLVLQANEKPEGIKSSENQKLLKATFENRELEQPETLLKVIDLITSQPEQFSKEQMGWANTILDHLAGKVNPETLSVPGVELSIADIDSLRVDVAEAMKDDAALNKAYARAADSYQKMIQLYHGEESRGFNLEYAYYLWKKGDIDQAKKIYTHFISKFPTEFTFYFAASRMYMGLKELKTARFYAEQAVNLSYGDNQIRSMERLIRVMGAEGLKIDAVKRGNEFLSKTQTVSPELVVRTNRYIKALKKAVDEVGEGKI